MIDYSYFLSDFCEGVVLVGGKDRLKGLSRCVKLPNIFFIANSRKCIASQKSELFKPIMFGSYDP